jgi:hypothetical protein
MAAKNTTIAGTFIQNQLMFPPQVVEALPHYKEGLARRPHGSVVELTEALSARRH